MTEQAEISSPHPSTRQRQPYPTLISIPIWLSFLGISVALVAILAILYIFFVIPYRAVDRKDPFTTGVLDPDAWLTIDYPRLLSREDQGAQTQKEIVVSLRSESETEGWIALAVMPQANAARLVNENGHPVSGRIELTVTQGIATPSTLFVEHTQVHTVNPYFDSAPLTFSLSLLSTTLTTTSKISLPLPLTETFVIREEPLVCQVLRKVIEAIPWPTFITWALALIALGGREAWNLRRDMEKLYQEMEEASQKGKIEKVRELYRDYSLRLWPRGSQFSLIHNRSLERCYRQCEADDNYKQAVTALEQGADKVSTVYLDRTLNWYPQHPKASLLKQILALGKEQQQQRQKTTLSPTLLKELQEALRNVGQTPPVVRSWIVRTLADHPSPEVKSILSRTLDEDPDLTVQSDAVWALAMQKRPDYPVPQVADDETVEKWWRECTSKEVDYPFKTMCAEEERGTFREGCFVAHPAYASVHDSRRSVAFFAGHGCGKTSFRLWTKGRYLLQKLKVLTVEYVNWGDWATDPLKLSAATHTQRILALAADQLDVGPAHLASPWPPHRDRLQGLVQRARQRGYEGGVCVLVDDLDTSPFARADPALVELLVWHLLGDFGLLNVPGLTFRFFLPTAVEKLVRRYESFGGGWLEGIRIIWSKELLLQVLRERLRWGGLFDPGREPSLRQLTDPLNFPPMDLDQALVDNAHASPRRLIRLADLLLRHRAQLWCESGERLEALYLQATDWPYLLEWLIAEGRPK